MKTPKSILVAVLFAGLAGVPVQSAETKSAPQGAAGDSRKAPKAKPYPLDYCVVSDEKFEGSDMKPFEMVQDGQTLKFCCKNCVKDFNKNPKKYLAKLDAAAKSSAAPKAGR